MQKKTKFGKLETAIMDVVWLRSRATVRDVVDTLGRKHDVAYTTVMTVMNRLVQRGCLQRRLTQSGAYSYSATESRDDLAAAATRQSFESLIHLYGDAALAQFLDQLDQIPPQKLQQLRRKLKNR